jgi:hypothetical protein
MYFRIGYWLGLLWKLFNCSLQLFFLPVIFCRYFLVSHRGTSVEAGNRTKIPQAFPKGFELNFTEFSGQSGFPAPQAARGSVRWWYENSNDSRLYHSPYSTRIMLVSASYAWILLPNCTVALRVG